MPSEGPGQREPGQSHLAASGAQPLCRVPARWLLGGQEAVLAAPPAFQRPSRHQVLRGTGRQAGRAVCSRTHQCRDWLPKAPFSSLPSRLGRSQVSANSWISLFPGPNPFPICRSWPRSHETAIPQTWDRPPGLTWNSPACPRPCFPFPCCHNLEGQEWPTGTCGPEAQEEGALRQQNS